MAIRKLRKYDNKKTPLTEEQIEDLIDFRFKNSYPHTKEYIRQGFRTVGGRFKFSRHAILKEDFIEQYNLSREGDPTKIEYDFSLLPDIIGNRSERVEVICKETIGGKELGKFTTTFKDLVERKIEVIRALKSYLEKAKTRTPDTKRTEDFLKRARAIHGDKYDYSEVVYLGSDMPVKLYCKSCKEYFWQTANAIVTKKAGCIKCYARNLDGSGDFKRLTTEEFVERAKEKWGDQIDYSETIYTGYRYKIKIKCNVCGEVSEVWPNHHLNSDYPCPICAKKLAGEQLRSDKEEFIKHAVEMHGDKYDYSKVVYVTRLTPVTIIDKATGKEFEQTPGSHLQGNGYKDSPETKSAGELKVMRVLNELGLNYKSEVIVNGIQGRNSDYVRIDFIVTVGDKDYWIEYNGMQHYSFNQKMLMYKHVNEVEGLERYAKQIQRDNNIREYCKSHEEIILIEIPYTYKSLKSIREILTGIFKEHKFPGDLIIQPQIYLSALE